MVQYIDNSYTEEEFMKKIKKIITFIIGLAIYCAITYASYEYSKLFDLDILDSFSGILFISVIISIYILLCIILFYLRKIRKSKLCVFLPDASTPLINGQIIDSANLPGIIKTMSAIRTKTAIESFTVAVITPFICVFTGCRLRLFQIDPLANTANNPALNAVVIVIAILVCFISACLLNITCAPYLFAMRKPSKLNYAPDNLYPNLYRLIRAAAKQTNVKKDVRIDINTDDKVDIEYYGSFIVIALGVRAISVLSENELYAVFVSKFLSLKTPAMKALKKFRVYYGIMREYLTQPILNERQKTMQFFCNNYAFIAMYASRQAMPNIDKTIKEMGLAADMASSVTKLRMLKLFDAEFNDFVPEPYYRAAEPRKNVCSTTCTAARNAILLRKDFWLGLLKKELPTTPNEEYELYPGRLEMLGTPDFDLSMPDENSAYYEDVKKIITLIDNFLYNQNSFQYEIKRRSAFILPMMEIESFESAGSLDTDDESRLSPENLRPVLEAYVAVHNTCEEEKICDFLIERYPVEKVHFAYCFKGLLLLSRYDDQGAELIRLAAQNNENFIECYASVVGEYFRRTGNREELKAFYSNIDEFKVQLRNANSLHNIKLTDNLGKPELPAALLNEIKNYILEVSDHKVIHSYAVKKTEEKLETTVIILDFDQNVDEEDRNDITSKVFYFLDGKNEFFTLLDAKHISQKLLKRVTSYSLF